MCRTLSNFDYKSGFIKHYLNCFLAKSTPVYAKSQVTKKTKTDNKKLNNL